MKVKLGKKINSLRNYHLNKAQSLLLAVVSATALLVIAQEVNNLQTYNQDEYVIPKQTISYVDADESEIEELEPFSVSEIVSAISNVENDSYDFNNFINNIAICKENGKSFDELDREYLKAYDKNDVNTCNKNLAAIAKMILKCKMATAFDCSVDEIQDLKIQDGEVKYPDDTGNDSFLMYVKINDREYTVMPNVDQYGKPYENGKNDSVRTLCNIYCSCLEKFRYEKIHPENATQETFKDAYNAMKGTIFTLSELLPETVTSYYDDDNPLNEIKPEYTINMKKDSEAQSRVVKALKGQKTVRH